MSTIVPFFFTFFLELVLDSGVEVDEDLFRLFTAGENLMIFWMSITSDKSEDDETLRSVADGVSFTRSCLSSEHSLLTELTVLLSGDSWVMLLFLGSFVAML